MRIVLQRVQQAQVTNFESASSNAGMQESRSIKQGLVLLVGVQDSDGESQAKWLAHKITHLRVFPSENNPQDRSVLDITGQILSIPQFTLFAHTRHGNRPDHTAAGSPVHAEQLWHQFNDYLKQEGATVYEGFFGAHMGVELINDGPYTIILDTEALGI